MQDGLTRDELLSAADFSRAVGTLYDCALEPALWPDAIAEVCRLTNCAAGVVEVTDPASRVQRV